MLAVLQLEGLMCNGPWSPLFSKLGSCRRGCHSAVYFEASTPPGCLCTRKNFCVCW